MQDIHRVFSNPLKTQSNKITSNGKLNPLQESRGGENIIRSNYNSKARVHQDRAKSRTRERERDQTHSYWYIPSAPRVNYSLVMESAGMMKMATGEGLPPLAGCRNGSRLVFGRYRGFWRRNGSRLVFYCASQSF